MSPPPLSEKSNSDWDGLDSETPLINEKLPIDDKTLEVKKKTRQFREVRLGIWTLYFPLTDSWRDYLPALNSLWLVYDLTRTIPIVWKFVLETLALGPVFFTVYFVSSTLVSMLPAVQLFNNSKILALVSAYKLWVPVLRIDLTSAFFYDLARRHFQRERYQSRSV